MVVGVPSHGAAEGRPRQDGHCWTIGGGGDGIRSESCCDGSHGEMVEIESVLGWES
jgi:hypothetical protein